MLLQETTGRQQDTGSRTSKSANRSDIRTRLAQLNRIDEIEVAVSQSEPEETEPAQTEANNAEQAGTTGETKANEVKETPTQTETVSGVPISFGKVLPELLSGNKTQTRRDWSDGHAAKFRRAYREGKLVRALSKDQRAKDSEQVGLLRLTCEPYEQTLADMSAEDLAAEGFPGMSKKEFINRFFEGEEEKEVWVLEFKFIPDKSNEPTQSELTQSELTQSESTQSRSSSAAIALLGSTECRGNSSFVKSPAPAKSPLSL